ncbi:MAG: transcriptional repressor LexA [Turicibacter sp.]|nr:transcriptional repressor LexA [Turicibacter sp.]
MKPISKRQQAILDFIKEEVDKRGYPPSVREIGLAVGLSSTASVHNQLNQLEKKGLIRKDKSTTRGIVLLSSNHQESVKMPELKSVVNVPVIGKVTAGTPIEAIEQPDEFFPLPTHLIPANQKVFMLNVHGDSMINAGIHDGDQIIVKQQQNAINGEIVVAMIEDEHEVTVKRFFKEADYIRLQPENDSLEPIISKNITVIGKVIGLFRTMQ